MDDVAVSTQIDVKSPRIVRAISVICIWCHDEYFTSLKTIVNSRHYDRVQSISSIPGIGARVHLSITNRILAELEPTIVSACPPIKDHFLMD
jgi:hypothetical protein